MLIPYISLNPGNNQIYTSPEVIKEVPEGYVRATTIYHVTKVDSKESADYSVTVRGSTKYYRYTSEEGRAAHKVGGFVPKTSNPNAVTCPACLAILEVETKDFQEYLLEKLMEAEEQQEPTVPAEPPTDTVIEDQEGDEDEV